MGRLDQLAPHHARALSEAVEYAVERYDPWAVMVTGTIVRGEADPRSDIDLYVLHDEPFRQRVQRWFNGVAVEIFVNPESAVLGYLESEAESGRLFTAHMLSTGVPVLVREEERMKALVAKARSALAKTPEWDGAVLTRDRYAAATLVEDALDRWEEDRVTALYLLSKGVDASVLYWFKSGGQNIPRNKEVVPELARSDPDLGALLERFFRSAPESERWEVGLEIAQRILGTQGFFEWESERDAV